LIICGEEVDFAFLNYTFQPSTEYQDLYARVQALLCRFKVQFYRAAQLFLVLERRFSFRYTY